MFWRKELWRLQVPKSNLSFLRKDIQKNVLKVMRKIKFSKEGVEMVREPLFSKI